MTQRTAKHCSVLFLIQPGIRDSSVAMMHGSCRREARATCAHVCAMVYIAVGVTVDLNLFPVRLSTCSTICVCVCEATNE